MRIVGEWQMDDDGVTRPVVRVKVLGVDGRPVADNFLVDSGADRTVFSATLTAQLRLSSRSPQPGLALSGIGGESAFVAISGPILTGIVSIQVPAPRGVEWHTAPSASPDHSVRQEG